ncbi:FecR domain-containing protein [Candidatus Gracilibacteria bacterium]|nr:FecR domain-containing protein [Candidatus Gracilibacteria bacterium]
MNGNVYYRKQKRQSGSYFLPFVSLIILVIIGVLIFQIISYFRDKQAKSLENKAAVEVLSGRAEMKIWEVDQWTEAVTGTILHEGDAIRTAPGSRVTMTLLNGSVVRMSSETEVELTALKTRDGQDEAGFHLRGGDIWLKRSSNDTVHAQFSVTTEHLEITSLGTIFAVTQAPRESVRVLDGKVQVTVRIPDGDTTRIAETLDVDFGQEVSLGKDDILALQNNTPIRFLGLIADSFRDSEWYKWNRLQDDSNIQNLSVQDAVQLQGQTPETPTEIPSEPSTVTASSTPVVTTVEPELIEALTSPVITTPSSANFTTKTGTVNIEGTVSSSTNKVEVTTYRASKPEPYVLKKYTAGQTKWSYVASRELGNLTPGENVFLFVAIDKNGTRSTATKLTINLDVPATPPDLTAPQVTTFNGTSSNEVIGDTVEIRGTIGKGIARVVVNDFTLTRYVPDSGVWSYGAKKEYGNFNDGTNSYRVYGVSADGQKTPVTTFEVIKRIAN